MKSIFITGPGKCGETFFYNIFKKNKKINAYDERRPLLQAYYKFIKYNNINIDDAPLFDEIKKEIIQSNKKNKIYLESSSYLSFHIIDLINKFDSKIIVLLRNPRDVCLSLLKTGWYDKKYFKTSSSKILGYQGVAKTFYDKHHNFSRISPKGKFFFKWNNLDPLIKTKWYWDETYKEIFKSLKGVSKQKFRVIKIEEFNYQKYLEICKWLRIKPNLGEFSFNLRTKFVKNNNKNKINILNIKKLKRYESKIEKLFYKENL